MSSHSLHDRIRQVARRARGLVLLHAMCWFVAVVVAATLALGLADYFLRYREAGARVLSSLAWVAICGWAFWRFVWPAITFRLEDVSVAQRVERSFPQLRDRLSSSIQFLVAGAGAAQLGSLTLQQAVVAEAEELARGIDLAGCLNSRATRQAVLLALPAVLLATAFVAADRDSSQLAMRRLAMPWSSEAWPRWNQLYFEDAPTRLAAGQDFQVTLRDANGRLPSAVVIQYWFEGDSENQIERYPMARQKNAKSHHRENITRSFQYRAVGGDDDTMAWIPLTVVEPVRVQQLRIRWQPPTHGALPASEVNGGKIEALQGTVFELSGRASRPVDSAKLVVEGSEPPIEVDAELAADGQSFQVPAWPADQVASGQYRIEIREADGVIGGYETRAAWRIVADAPPEITLLNPTADDIATANAVVSIRAVASDDLAIESVAVDLGGKSEFPYRGPLTPPAKESLDQRDEREIVASYELGALNLQPDDVLQMSLTATDYAGQSSTAAVRSWRIVTADEFAIALQERQKRLKQQLAEALRIQVVIQTQTTALQTQLGGGAPSSDENVLSEADVARLQGADLQQRQVQRLLDDKDDGAAMLVARLIATIESNRVDQSKVAARLADFAARLRSINQDLLPHIRSDLVRAAKAIEATGSRPADIVAFLDRAGQNQNAVVEALQEMIDRLSEWDDYRRFASDFAALLRSQRDLRSRVGDLTTLGKRWDELSAAQRSDLIRLSTEQGSLLRQFDRLLASMIQFTQQLDSTSAAHAEMLRSAAAMARERAVAEHMLEAKSALSQNQLGTARREVEQAEVGLQAIVDLLAGRSEDSQARTRRLAEASDEVNALAEAQGDLREKLAEASDIPDAARRQAVGRDLAKAQAELADLAGEVAEALKSMGAGEAAASVERGGERARRASAHASQGDMTDAARAAEEAEQRFAEAGRQVASQLQQARERGLNRMSARFREAITKLATTQQALIDRFAAERPDPPPREAAGMFEPLAGEQEALAAETDSTRDEFQPPRALGLALTWAARSMREAAAGLRSEPLAADVTSLQRDALRKLQALLATIEQAAASSSEPGTSEGQPQEDGDRQPPRYSEAELRIVLGMQAEIHQQTNELEKESRGAASQQERQVQQRRRLAADQEQLSQVVDELSQPPTSPDASPSEPSSEPAPQDAEDPAAAPGDFDPRLLEGLDDRPPAPAGEDLGQPSERDPLSVVAERMGHVARRIVEDETLQPAQQIQQEILRELQRLADEAAQQSQQQNSQTAGQPKPSDPDGDQPRPRDDAVGDSPRGVDPIEAVWGSLPERVRQGIRSPLHEEFLPEYEQVIQEYYKRLAEQQRSRGGR